MSESYTNIFATLANVTEAVDCMLRRIPLLVQANFADRLVLAKAHHLALVLELPVSHAQLHQISAVGVGLKELWLYTILC